MLRTLGRSLARLWRGCARVVRWSLGPVDDEPAHATNVIPMPGPAHGPVPAIDLRVERPRRKAS